MSPLRLPTEREFWRFAHQIPLATKDYGIRPIQPWGTQRTLLRRILYGVPSGKHQFLVLKARQVGCSLFMQLLTLFWMERYPGLQGLTVTDSEENKQYFRDLFLAMVETLAEHRAGEATPGAVLTDTNVGSELRSKNQVQITWANQSRLLLQMAGPRTWKRLGVGRGLSFLHGTEFGLWTQGERAMTYLRSAFSELNPAALYVFEGTARGKNFFYDLWMQAQKARTIDAVFLSWWLREDNRITRMQKKLWATYGLGALTAKEREWDRLLRKRDKVVLEPEQWAWRRWYVQEKAGGNHRVADQEMPTVWEDAFAASQERPFLDDITNQRIRGAVQAPTAAYVYRWGNQLEDTIPEPAGSREPMLRVWHTPDGMRPVVVAAVPGYSALEDDPSWVVSVWAANLERDQIEQVAEFHTEVDLGIQPFAWVCLHLAGAYGAEHPSFILEVSGVGMGVLAEIKQLVATGYGTSRKPGFHDVLSNVRHYIWRRPDSMMAMGALQWKSTPELQGMLQQRFRDQLKRGSAIIRSSGLADEVARLEGKGDTYNPTGDTPHGHRAFAGALAIESYVSQMVPRLRKFRQQGAQAQNVGHRTLQTFFASLGAR